MEKDYYDEDIDELEYIKYESIRNITYIPSFVISNNKLTRDFNEINKKYYYDTKIVIRKIEEYLQNIIKDVNSDLCLKENIKQVFNCEFIDDIEE